MSSGDPFKSRRRGGENSFTEGERVQITRGALEGLTGVLSGGTKQGHCAVKLDDVASGVLVVISRDMLKRLPDGRASKIERP
jgi:hypothetical protein